MEVCIINRIKKEFINANISYGEKLLKKFKSLGDRFLLAETIGIKLPTKDYNKKIIEPRNNTLIIWVEYVAYAITS